MGLEKLRKLENDMAEAMAKAASDGKRAVKEAVDEILGQHPEVAAVSWTQFTPYFNDGEPCEFRVNEIEVSLMASDYEDASPAGDDGDWLSTWDLDYGERKGRHPNLISKLKELSRCISSAGLRHAMEATFGDHVRVIVARDGTDVQEYEHD